MSFLNLLLILQVEITMNVIKLKLYVNIDMQRLSLVSTHFYVHISLCPVGSTMSY